MACLEKKKMKKNYGRGKSHTAGLWVKSSATARILLEVKIWSQQSAVYQLLVIMSN